MTEGLKTGDKNTNVSGITIDPMLKNIPEYSRNTLKLNKDGAGPSYIKGM